MGDPIANHVGIQDAPCPEARHQELQKEYRGWLKLTYECRQLPWEDP